MPAPCLPLPIPLANVLADVHTHLTKFLTVILSEVSIHVMGVPFASPGALDDTDQWHGGSAWHKVVCDQCQQP
jgi:hypothetical protein